MNNTSNRDFPNAQKLIETAIYVKHDVSHMPDEAVLELESFRGPIDAYCLECKKPSVFRSESPPLFDYSGSRVLSTSQTRMPPPKHLDSQQIIENFEARGQIDRVFSISLNCSREPNHRIWFFFRIFRGNLIKVGQHPSFADFHLQALDKYDRILSEEERREFGTATGLYAHGVGIGSFVYLRRIFEALIEGAHEKARLSPEWNEDSYQKGRIRERIMLLKGFLPDALIENADIYSLLSQGIHSLNEEECLKNFGTLRLGIEYILDEALDRQRKEQQLKQLRQEVAKIKESA